MSRAASFRPRTFARTASMPKCSHARSRLRPQLSVHGRSGRAPPLTGTYVPRSWDIVLWACPRARKHRANPVPPPPRPPRPSRNQTRLQHPARPDPAVPVSHTPHALPRTLPPPGPTAGVTALGCPPPSPSLADLLGAPPPGPRAPRAAAPPRSPVPQHRQTADRVRDRGQHPCRGRTQSDPERQVGLRGGGP